MSSVIIVLVLAYASVAWVGHLLATVEVAVRVVIILILLHKPHALVGAFIVALVIIPEVALAALVHVALVNWRLVTTHHLRLLALSHRGLESTSVRGRERCAACGEGNGGFEIEFTRDGSTWREFIDSCIKPATLRWDEAEKKVRLI